MWLRSPKSHSPRASAQRPKARQHPRLVRPELEMLEGRVLPSTYVVDALTDTGAGAGLTGDLRYCVTNATSGNDVITFAPGLTGTIGLDSTLPLNASVTIQGPGAGQLTVDRDPYSSSAFDGFTVASAATVQISGLTISIFEGNGIDNTGTVILSNSTITGCVEGIDNSGSATINSCTLWSNGNNWMLSGQAIVNTGSVTINSSSLFGNGSNSEGGALYNNGTATINSSTLANNRVSGLAGQSVAGGAILQAGGTLAIDSSTIGDNSALGGNNNGTYSGGTTGIFTGGDGLGGGLYLAAGSVSIDHSTIAGNVAAGGYGVTPGYGYGGGIYTASGVSLQVHDSIIANNVADYGPDLNGSLTSLGHNLIGNTAGGSGFVPSDLQNVNPQLGPFQNNGGPTQTMALMPGSPAINAGDPTGAPAYDQRGPGFQRTFNGTIDIGSFEVQNYFVVSGFPSTTTAGVAHNFTLTVMNHDGSADAGYVGTVHFTSSDGIAGLPANYTFTAADGGIHPFTATLKTAGPQSITASDVAVGSLTSREAGITVTPAVASKFIISAPSSVRPGTLFSLALTVEDAYGNVVTGYVGSVHFSSTERQATLPKSYTFTASDKGVHTFNGLILHKKGQQKISITDTLNASLTGSVVVDVL